MVEVLGTADIVMGQRWRAGLWWRWRNSVERVLQDRLHALIATSLGESVDLFIISDNDRFVKLFPEAVEKTPLFDGPYLMAPTVKPAMKRSRNKL